MELPSTDPVQYCRLCFSQHQLRWVFQPTDAPSHPRLNMIVECLGLWLAPELDLPCAVCRLCSASLESFDAFRERSRECDLALRKTRHQQQQQPEQPVPVVIEPQVIRNDSPPAPRPSTIVTAPTDSELKFEIFDVDEDAENPLVVAEVPPSNGISVRPLNELTAQRQDERDENLLVEMGSTSALDTPLVPPIRIDLLDVQGQVLLSNLHMNNNLDMFNPPTTVHNPLLPTLIPVIDTTAPLTADTPCLFQLSDPIVFPLAPTTAASTTPSEPQHLGPIGPLIPVKINRGKKRKRKEQLIAPKSESPPPAPPAESPSKQPHFNIRYKPTTAPTVAATTTAVEPSPPLPNGNNPSNLTRSSCPHCDKSFIGLANLEKHQRKAHPAEVQALSSTPPPPTPPTIAPAPPAVPAPFRQISPKDLRRQLNMYTGTEAPSTTQNTRKNRYSCNRCSAVFYGYGVYAKHRATSHGSGKVTTTTTSSGASDSGSAGHKPRA